MKPRGIILVYGGYRELTDFQRQAGRQIQSLLGGEGELIRMGALDGPPRDPHELLDLLATHKLKLAPAGRSVAWTYGVLYAALSQAHREHDRRESVAGK